MGLSEIGQFILLSQTKPPEAAAGHDTLVLRTKTLLASMAHECTDRTSRRAEIPPPEESTKGAAAPFVERREAPQEITNLELELYGESILEPTGRH